MSALRNAILLALPSSIGAPMDTLAVVLALKSGAAPVVMSEAQCERALWVLFARGLVCVYARRTGAMRWSRSPEADALPVVRERFGAVEAM